MVSSPFLEAIKLNKCPKNFLSYKCPGYKGKDHIAHVFLFKTIMSPLNMPLDKRDAMLCRSFVATLYNSTSKWFSNPNLGSITYFSKLDRLFVTNYTSNKPLKKESHHMLFIVQNMDESVEAFMKMFCVEKIKISYCLNAIVF